MNAYGRSTERGVFLTLTVAIAPVTVRPRGGMISVQYHCSSAGDHLENSRPSGEWTNAYGHVAAVGEDFHVPAAIAATSTPWPDGGWPLDQFQRDSSGPEPGRRPDGTGGMHCSPLQDAANGAVLGVVAAVLDDDSVAASAEHTVNAAAVRPAARGRHNLPAESS
jgi:hypothetical protein